MPDRSKAIRSWFIYFKQRNNSALNFTYVSCFVFLPQLSASCRSQFYIPRCMWFLKSVKKKIKSRNYKIRPTIQTIKLKIHYHHHHKSIICNHSQHVQLPLMTVHITNSPLLSFHNSLYNYNPHTKLIGSYGAPVLPAERKRIALMMLFLLFFSQPSLQMGDSLSNWRVSQSSHVSLKTNVAHSSL